MVWTGPQRPWANLERNKQKSRKFRMVLCLDNAGCHVPSWRRVPCLLCVSFPSVSWSGHGDWKGALCGASRRGFLDFCSLHPWAPHSVLAPPPCQLAGSFALLVGSDLRTGYGKGVMEREAPCSLWLEPCLLRARGAPVCSRNPVGGVFWHRWRGFAGHPHCTE